MTPTAASAGEPSSPRDPRRTLIDQLTAERHAPVPHKPSATNDSPRAQQIRRRQLKEER